MSMKPQEISPVPEGTVRVARAANPKGNAYMRLPDELGSIYKDQMFTALFPRCGQPAEAPWSLALVTVMKYMEGLSDRQAKVAYAIRAGVESTISQAVRASDVRQAGYCGLPKTRLQHVITATATNVRRIVSWLIEPSSRPTQVSRLAALALQQSKLVA